MNAIINVKKKELLFLSEVIILHYPIIAHLCDYRTID